MTSSEARRPSPARVAAGKENRKKRKGLTPEGRERLRQAALVRLFPDRPDPSLSPLSLDANWKAWARQHCQSLSGKSVFGRAGLRPSWRFPRGARREPRPPVPGPPRRTPPGPCVNRSQPLPRGPAAKEVPETLKCGTLSGRGRGRGPWPGLGAGGFCAKMLCNALTPPHPNGNDSCYESGQPENVSEMRALLAAGRAGGQDGLRPHRGPPRAFALTPCASVGS